ncbi:MAG: aspartyl protease family protein [Bacteroidota bacterium]
MRSYLLLLTLLLTLSACNRTSLNGLLLGGSVEDQQFFTQVPFEFKGKEIIIRAKVNGVEGRFMVDTGAPNVISKSFREKLGLEALLKRKVGDSQLRENKEEFTRLDVVEVGDLKFRDIGAVIIDLQRSKEIACYQLDGLIGANLMRKAYWQFDYQQQQITITDQYERLNLPKDAITIPFKPKTQGTPHLELSLANQKVKTLKLDTGSSGYMGINRRHTKKAEQKYKLQKAVGYSSSGIYGAGKDTTVLFLADSLWIGGQPFTKAPIRCNRSRSNTLGNRFFEAYQMTLDWVNNKMFLVPNPTFEASPRTSHGIYIRYGEQQPIIGTVVIGSEAMQKGVEAEDLVLEINGIDTRQMAHRDYCDTMFERRFFPEEGKLRLKIQKQKTAQVLELELEQFMLFEE